MSWNIPLFKIYWDNDDVKAVSETIQEGANWAIGPRIKEFEERIANYVGSSYAIVFNSGTSALHSALIAYGIKKGDEVLVPSFTFVATANTPVFVGAKPVFVDIEKKTFGLNPEDVKKKITNKSRIIMPIHYGGCPCSIKELAEIADDNNLILIEDCAEALGAKVYNKNVGTFGDMGVFSFCQNKIITTGEGGAIVTDSKEMYEKLKLIRSHGRLEKANYFLSTESANYIQLGYNFRMSNITAALGISQLKKVDKIIAMRQENANYIMEKLSKIGQIEVPYIPINYTHVFQLFTIRIKSGSKTRNSLMAYLKDKGIMSKIYFEPAHQTKFMKSLLGYEVTLPSTVDISGQVLTLPLFPNITLDEMNHIVDSISNFFNN